MKTRYIEQEMVYTGVQLHSNYAYSEFDLLGDSIIAFCGKCDIPAEQMVDIEDVKDSATIYSESMLHFIVEHYDTDLEKAVLWQLVLTTIVGEVLREMSSSASITRRGSDLYDGDAKLSISIATVTPLSSLIHFGINIVSDNTPVKTKGLKDYRIDARKFAEQVIARYKSEQTAIDKARCKVKWTQ